MNIINFLGSFFCFLSYWIEEARLIYELIEVPEALKEFTFKGKLDHFAMVAHLLSILSSINVPKEKWEELEEGGQNDMEHVFNYFSEEKTKKILDQGISQGRAEGKAECKAETKQTHLEILQWLQVHDRLVLSIQALKRSDIEHFKKRVLDHWI